MTTKLKIMSYNVQWFSGINSQIPMQERIVSKYNPQINCLQELSTNGKINSVGRKMLFDYPYQYLSYHKNYLGIASKYKLKDVKAYDFKHQDPEDMARFGETRAYIKGTLEIDGKRIKIINAHLSYLTPSVKYQQMQELFNSAEKAEYAIIIGDFNCFYDYDILYNQFIESGYNLANCYTKVTKTWTDKTKAKYLPQLTYPTDNIIKSGNITIKKVMFDKTKMKYLNGDIIDHIPVVTRLYIK